MRVALDEPIFAATKPAVSFAIKRNVTVCARGTANPVAVFNAESGGAELEQPLRTGGGGQPRGQNNEEVWVPVGSYDLRVLPVMPGEATKVIRWEASAGIEFSGVQPLDPDLSAIAELKTEPFGRSLLTKGTAEAIGAALGFPFLNAKWFGAIGNGTTDDTEALQAAINAAIALKLPLFLPAGTYKTTAKLVWSSGDVAFYGAGGALSIIKPAASNFTALEVGPGEIGSGSASRGYIKHLGFSGGNNSEVQRTKAGVEATTGTAALKLNGWRMGVIEGVQVYASFDIAFDMWHNCYGTIYTNCRAEYNSCRVGMNIRPGSPESGSDSNWHNCWLAGEVAAVHVAGNGGGYHFRGGQLGAGNQATEQNDLRGVIIAGKDYTTQAEGGSYNIDFHGIDFEGPQGCWIVRGFINCGMHFTNCAFNANRTTAPLCFGIIKFTNRGQAKITLDECRVGGKFSNPSEELLVFTGSGSAFSFHESNTSGTCTANGVSLNVEGDMLARVCKVPNAHARNAAQWLDAGVLFRKEGEALQRSLDWGSTWKTVKVE